jgi:urease accessory protein
MTARILYTALLMTGGFLFAPLLQAHTGVHDTAGLTAGFLHPLTGIDHIAVAVVAGMWAAHSCRHCALCAAGFLLMLVLGALLGVGALVVPQVDILTIVSVVTAGTVVVLSLSMPEIRGYALFGGLSLFYGFLHISGLGGPVNLPAYILGMASSMGMLLALGVVLRQILSTRPALSR